MVRVYGAAARCEPRRAPTGSEAPARSRRAGRRSRARPTRRTARAARRSPSPRPAGRASRPSSFTRPRSPSSPRSNRPSPSRQTTPTDHGPRPRSRSSRSATAAVGCSFRRSSSQRAEADERRAAPGVQAERAELGGREAARGRRRSAARAASRAALGRRADDPPLHRARLARQDQLTAERAQERLGDGRRAGPGAARAAAGRRVPMQRVALEAEHERRVVVVDRRGRSASRSKRLLARRPQVRRRRPAAARRPPRPAGSSASRTPSRNVRVASLAPPRGERERVRAARAEVGGDHEPSIVVVRGRDVPPGAVDGRATLCRGWRCAARGTRWPPARPRSTSATRRRGAEELAGLFGRLGADPRGRQLRRGRLRAGADDRRARRALRPRARARRLAGDARAGAGQRDRARTSTFRAVSGERLDGVDDGERGRARLLPRPPAPALAREVVRAYLREFARVLAPGGEAFVQVPVLERARRPRSGAALRAPARPRSPAGPTTAPPSAASGSTAPSSTARSPTPASACVAEDEGPSAYRFSRDRFLRLARR